VGPAGQREERRGVSASGHARDGPRGLGGGTRRAGERVGPDSAQPRGEISFFFFYFYFSPISISLIPFSSEQ
jgi:hypothetical protein